MLFRNNSIRFFSAISKETQQFLSILEVRGMCANSVNTRRAAASSSSTTTGGMMASNSSNNNSSTSNSDENDNNDSTSANMAMMMQQQQQDLQQQQRNVIHNFTNNTTNNKSTVPQSVACTVCGKRFSTQRSLNQHFAKRHQKTQKQTESVAASKNVEVTNVNSAMLGSIVNKWSRLVTKSAASSSVVAAVIRGGSKNPQQKKQTQQEQQQFSSSITTAEQTETVTDEQKNETENFTSSSSSKKLDEKKTTDDTAERQDATSETSSSSSSSSSVPKQKDESKMVADTLHPDSDHEIVGKTPEMTMTKSNTEEETTPTTAAANNNPTTSDDDNIQLPSSSNSKTSEDVNAAPTETTQQKQQQRPSSSTSTLITLTDDDRRDLLSAQLDIVDKTCETLIAWAQRNDSRKRARHKLNNLVLPPEAANQSIVGELVKNAEEDSNNTSISNLIGNIAFPTSDPFYISKRHPWGSGDFVSCISLSDQKTRRQRALMNEIRKSNNSNRSNSSLKALQQLAEEPLTACDVGGMASCSLIGVVTSVKTGTMKSLTAAATQQQQESSKPEDIFSAGSTSNKNTTEQNNNVGEKPAVASRQRATILELSCRNFQCEKLSGRVSMIKNNIKVRIRETKIESKNNKRFALRKGDPREFGPPLWKVGDILFCRGQLQLHALYDLASKRWQVNGMVVDICRNTGEVVKVCEGVSSNENENESVSSEQ